MNNKKVLVVAPNFPFPADYGGAVDIWKRILLLSELGYEIDLIATVKTKPDKEHIEHVSQYVKHIYISKRKNKIKDLFFSYWPLQASSRIDLKNIKLTEEYDLVLLESEYVSFILKNPLLKGKKYVLRVHNNEKKYFKSLALSSRFRPSTLYYWSEYYKFSNLTPFLLNEIDYFLFISNEEFEEFLRNHPLKENHSIFLPAPIELLNFKKRITKNRSVLFIGSLFMPNNIEAISWYLQNVHTNLLNIPDYKFIIVGSTRGYDVSSFINKLKNFSSVEYHLDVPDLEPFYDQASVFVNPMLNGAGVKIKSLNALVEGLPLVSSKIGSEGIGLKDKEHFLLANTPQEFVNAIKNLFDNPSLGEKIVRESQQYLKSQNHRTILQKFLSKL